MRSFIAIYRLPFLGYLARKLTLFCCNMIALHKLSPENTCMPLGSQTIVRVLYSSPCYFQTFTGLSLIDLQLTDRRHISSVLFATL